jgi:diguanylate cyclase (GGDEF)-like protein
MAGRLPSRPPFTWSWPAARSWPWVWPRRLAYPAAGTLLSFGLVAGLLTLEGWQAHRPPTISWIAERLRAQPLVYAYLFLATLIMMTVLGWIVGRKEDLLEELSVTDPLTGLANRRRLRAAFNDELNRAARYGTPLALLLVDLDRLKDVNDRLGHAAGDRALQLVAEALRRSCRTTDLVARHGGDEFVVLAVNTTAPEALALAHRIRATLRRLGAGTGKRARPPAPGGAATRPTHLTVSVGAADLDAAALPTFDALHAAADQALYAAKSAGRDRAMAAPPRFGSGARFPVIELRRPARPTPTPPAPEHGVEPASD